MKNKINYLKKRPIKWLILIVAILIAITAVKATTLDKTDEVNTSEVIAVEQVDPLPVIPEPITEPTKEQVKEEIIRQAELFSLGINTMLALAECESGFRWDAKNSNSTATGVFQFIKSTWANTQSGKNDISVFNYKANIKEAMLLYSQGKGRYEWRDCYIKMNLTD